MGNHAQPALLGRRLLCDVWRRGVRIGARAELKRPGRLHQHRRLIHRVSVRHRRRGALRPQDELQDTEDRSTGSGGGIKAFCGGVGVEHPDIANSSRRITRGERSRCAQNGVTQIVEVKIGYDGIVLANAKTSTPLN
jgi:hypothetical protein